MTVDRILRLTIACVIVLGGCSPAAPQWPTTDPAIDQAVATQLAMQETGAPADASAVSTGAFSTDQPIQLDSTSAPASLLAGLVVYSGGALQFQADGSMKQLSAAQIEALAPDLQSGLINTNGDIWLQTFADQNTVRLTLTETKVECCATWWTNHPEKILMLSNALGGNSGVATNGYLTVVKQDGTGYTVLDPDHPSSGTPAVSADGTWIAYGNGPSGWIFGGEMGPQELKPQDYGLQGSGILSSPAWSPSGDRLAWAWRDDSGMVAPLVFDLTAKTYQIAQNAVNSGAQIIGQLAWDPTGRWLVYAVRSSSSAVNGIWMMDTSGTSGKLIRISEKELSTGAWSPDGTKLALSTYRNDQAGQIWMFDLTGWKFQPVDVSLPASAPAVLEWQ